MAGRDRFGGILLEPPAATATGKRDRFGGIVLENTTQGPSPLSVPFVNQPSMDRADQQVSDFLGAYEPPGVSPPDMMAWMEDPANNPPDPSWLPPSGPTGPGIAPYGRNPSDFMQSRYDNTPQGRAVEGAIPAVEDFLGGYGDDNDPPPFELPKSALTPTAISNLTTRQREEKERAAKQLAEDTLFAFTGPNPNEPYKEGDKRLGVDYRRKLIRDYYTNLPYPISEDVRADKATFERYRRLNELATGAPLLDSTIEDRDYRQAMIDNERAIMKVRGVDPLQYMTELDSFDGPQGFFGRNLSAMGNQVADSAANIYDALRDPPGDDTFGTRIRQQEAAWREGVEDIKDERSALPNSVNEVTRAASQNAPQLAATAAVGFATRNPSLALATMLGPSSVEAYQVGRANGLSDGEAAGRAIVLAGVEIATMKAGGAVAGSFGGRTFEEIAFGVGGKSAQKGALNKLAEKAGSSFVEGFEETAAGAGQQFGDFVLGLQDELVGDETPEELAMAFAVGFVAAGTMNGISSFGEFVANPTKENAAAAGITPELAQTQRQRQALADAARVKMEAMAAEAPQSPVDATPQDATFGPELPAEVAQETPPEAVLPPEAVQPVQADSEAPVEPLGGEYSPPAATPQKRRLGERITAEPVEPSQTLRRTASWVIRDRATGEVVQETFQRSVADKINKDKYEAVPIQEHLASLNRLTPSVAPPDAPPVAHSQAQADSGVAKKRLGERLPTLKAVDFKQKLTETATSPEEADALYSLVEARAEAAGESVDDYVGKRIADVTKTDQRNSAYLKQQGPQPKGKRPRGEVSFLRDDGRAIIRAFRESQDASTLIHEVGHVFRRDLANEQLAAAEKWAGVQAGKWSRNAEEKFARGFEQYMREGKAPTPALKGVFDKFKQWLTSVYKAIKGSPIDVKMTPEITSVMDSLFSPVVAQEVAQEQSVAIDASETPSAAEPSEVQQTFWQSVEDRFRGLANQTEDLTSRQVNYEVDEEMGYPERKKWADAEAAANARLAADPVGELRKFEKAIDEANASGGTIDLRDMADAVVLNKLKDHASQQINNPEARALHRKLHEAFRKSRTEQARSLGYRDPVSAADPTTRRRRSITDAISEPTPEERAARDAARTPEEHAAVDSMYEKRYRKAKEKLAAIGIDLDNLDAIASDPEKSMAVLEHFRPKAESRADYLFEYWRNAILSGPRTQITNVAGNSIFAAWNLGPERAAESFVNLFRKDKKAASFGEFKYLAGGVAPGVLRGLRNAAKAWRLESSSLAEELGRDGAFKIDGPRGAIPGKLGRLVRAFGYRPLMAADEFAKSVVVTMEVGAHAFRAGKAKGLSGEELQNFISNQVDNLDSFAWNAAFAKAEELTFQGQRGLVAQSLVSGSQKLRKIRGVRWVIPFQDTPAAIIEEGIKRMPILGAILDYAEARRGGANIADAGMTATLARQLIALGGMGLIWAGVDDEEPWITGAAVLTDKAERELAYRTNPPMSIKLGDNWYSYDKVEPFATAIAWTVDAIRGVKDGTPVSTLAFSSAQQLKNKSYLDGLGDAVDAVQGVLAGDVGSAEEYVGKFAASWVPNLYRQTMGSADGEIPERRVWGSEWEHAQRVLRRSAESAEIPGIDAEPRYDIWGRPIRFSDSWGSPATDFAWNLTIPVRVKGVDKITEADVALSRWNSQNPDDRVTWTEPMRSVEDAGVTHSLSDQQFSEYAKLSGEIARYAVEGLDFSSNKPVKQDIEAVGNLLGDARKAARTALLPKWRAEWGTAKPVKQSPFSAKEVGDELLKEFLVDMAERGLGKSPHPKKKLGEKPESYDARKAEWDAKQQSAANWLKAHKSSPAVQAAVKEIKIPAPPLPRNKNGSINTKFGQQRKVWQEKYGGAKELLDSLE